MSFKIYSFGFLQWVWNRIFKQISINLGLDHFLHHDNAFCLIFNILWAIPKNKYFTIYFHLERELLQLYIWWMTHFDIYSFIYDIWLEVYCFAWANNFSFPFVINLSFLYCITCSYMSKIIFFYMCGAMPRLFCPMDLSIIVSMSCSIDYCSCVMSWHPMLYFSNILFFIVLWSNGTLLVFYNKFRASYSVTN